MLAHGDKILPCSQPVANSKGKHKEKALVGLCFACSGRPTEHSTIDFGSDSGIGGRNFGGGSGDRDFANGNGSGGRWGGDWGGAAGGRGEGWGGAASGEGWGGPASGWGGGWNTSANWGSRRSEPSAASSLDGNEALLAVVASATTGKRNLISAMAKILDELQKNQEDPDSLS